MPNYKTHLIFAFLPIPWVLNEMIKICNYPQDFPVCTGFLSWWVLHSMVITPDVDVWSIPSKRLGSAGWVIRKLTHHRGIMHRKKFWILYFLVQYQVLGWWVLGGVYPVFSHLLLDDIITGVKRKTGKKIFRAWS